MLQSICKVHYENVRSYGSDETMMLERILNLKRCS